MRRASAACAGAALDRTALRARTAVVVASLRSPRAARAAPALAIAREDLNAEAVGQLRKASMVPAAVAGALMAVAHESDGLCIGVETAAKARVPRVQNAGFGPNIDIYP